MNIDDIEHLSHLVVLTHRATRAQNEINTRLSEFIVRMVEEIKDEDAANSEYLHKVLDGLDDIM